MYVALVISTVLLAAMLAMSASMKLGKQEQAVAIIGGMVGVPLRYFPVLAGLELAGAAGIFAGLWLQPLGTLAAACLVAYFIGALAGHLRVGDTKNLAMPLPTWPRSASSRSSSSPSDTPGRPTITPPIPQEKLMKAFGISARDTQPTLLDVPQPEPAPGEVLVDVEAASVNGFDLAVAAGYVWDMLPHEFPVVLGRDLVGTVTAVGEGVEGIRVGDRVAGAIPGMDLGARTGSFAEQVALPGTAVTRVPAGVSVEDAAVVGLAGVAAHDAVDALGLQDGQSVLVSGATGGVGSIAIQLATAAGATVIATARPGQEDDYVRSLGAAHTVDYTGDVPAAVREIAPDGVDHALHLAGDAAAVAQSVRVGGTVATTLGATAEQVGRGDVTVAGIMAAATPDKLAVLLGHVAAGHSRVNIEARVPLDNAQDAFGLFADGTLGKVLITL
jgi:NADPH:quinone reductase-like Zn-dependent oxidoreductase